MNQSQGKRLLPKLRYKLHERRNLKNPEGPEGRHNKIRKTVTALFKYERIEMNYHRADESRGYAERLISDAIRYGDTHQPTMEMADYWLLEKQLVHKLFKVLVPRYQNCGLTYTKLWRAPNVYPGHGRPKCVLELRNNIFPTLGEDKSFNKNLLHNVLLDAARKEFNLKRATEAAKAVSEAIAKEEKKSEEVAKAETAAAAAAESNIASADMQMADAEGGENAGNERGSDSKEESSEAVSHLEKDLDKLELSEEKEKKSPSDKEKS